MKSSTDGSGRQDSIARGDARRRAGPGSVGRDREIAARDPQREAATTARWALIPLFFLSGAAALAYEVLWVRQLGFVLGGSGLAVSTVLATFFGGLGLGSHLGGKLADRLRRPLLAYAVAEFAIGLLALATPVLLDASGAVYLGLYRAFEGSPTLVTAARVVAAALILLPPTTLMGATLPLGARFYIRRVDSLGRGLSLLYGVNTLGGVAGCAAVGYVAILEFGVRNSFLVAVAVNLLVALGAVLLDRLAPPARSASPAIRPTSSPIDRVDPVAEPARGRAEAATPRARRRTGSGGSRPPVSSEPLAAHESRLLRLAAVGFAVSGFTAIAYEVLWTRALSFAIGNSVYAFTTILAVFLAGLVPGAFLAGRISDRLRDPFRLLGWVQVAVAAVVLGLFAQAGRLPALTSALVERFGAGHLGTDIVTKVIPTAAALLLPAMVIGLTFPLVVRVAAPGLERIGRRIGSLYAVNTIGGIVGSLVAGFLLLPCLGLARGMLAVAAVNLATGAFFFRSAQGRGSRTASAALAAGAAVAAVAAIPLIHPQPFLKYTSIGSRPGVEILFHEEGRTASVAVSEESENGAFRTRTLHINLLGASVVDRYDHMQKYYGMVALVPAALHPEPRSVFVAGLASGVTTGAAALDARTERVTCVEISPEVIRAAGWFGTWNYGVVENTKVRILADDARAWLATTEERFDIIVTDVFLSAVTGTCALYSREFFELCRSRLAPGGWTAIGAGNLHFTDRVVARTFAESFPHVMVLVDPDRSAANRVFLLGANEPFAIDPSSVERTFAQPAFGGALASFGFASSESLLRTYLCDGGTLAEHLADAAICTDDRPVIDFQAVAWAEGFISDRTDSGERKQAGVGILSRRLGGLKPIPLTRP